MGVHGLKHQLRRWIWILLFVVFVVGFVVFQWLPAVETNLRMQKRLDQLNTELSQALEEKRVLESTLHTLTQNPRAMERLARERLGYSRPGETVVKFVSPQTNANSALIK
jgi:cell division protein FtsB